LSSDIQRLKETILRFNEQNKEVVVELNNLNRRVKQLSKMTFSTSRREETWSPAYELTNQIYSNELIKVLQKETYEIGPYELNTRTRELIGKGEIVKLTTKEMFLLAIFAANVNVFVDREYCLNAIWRETSYMKSRSMDVYICKIRNYFNDDDVNLVNRHGKGYILLVSDLGPGNIIGGRRD
jgi:DNA-binding response OmpR family regulator